MAFRAVAGCEEVDCLSYLLVIVYLVCSQVTYSDCIGLDWSV